MNQEVSFGRREFLFGAGAMAAGAAAAVTMGTATEAQAAEVVSATAEPRELFVAIDDYVPPAPVELEGEDPCAEPREEYIFQQPASTLAGKIALVTGASSGIGREIARVYAREGATVVATARREDRLAALAEESADYEGSIVYFVADLTDRDQVRQLFEYTYENFGKLDILVNNAGTIGGFQSAETIMEGAWDYVMELNLTAPVLSMKYALQSMLEEGSGCIINIASVAGMRATVGGIEYSTSKRGLIAATQNTAYVFAQRGIRCNVICPGGFHTEVQDHMQYIDEETMERIGTASGSICRQGEPEEIAYMALWLASPAAVGINGAVFNNDGGWMC